MDEEEDGVSVQHIPGRGRGLIAKQDFAVGEVVLVDTPLAAYQHSCTACLPACKECLSPLGVEPCACAGGRAAPVSLSADQLAAAAEFDGFCQTHSEHFQLAAQIIARIAAGTGDVDRGDLKQFEAWSWLGFGCDVPWELAVEGRAHWEEQRRGWLHQAVALFTAVLGPGAAAVQDLLTVEYWDGLMGMLTRNVVCMEYEYPWHLIGKDPRWLLGQLREAEQTRVESYIPDAPYEFEVVESEDEEAAKPTAGPPAPELVILKGTALYPRAAMTNHSCQPNVETSFDWGTGAQLALVAIRPIAAGEEVLLSYVDETWPGELRRRKLLWDYGFLCTCPACVLPPPKSGKGRHRQRPRK